MERPSKDTLIRYFSGKCLPHELEPINLYLAMDIDQEFVQACMKEAWTPELYSKRSQFSVLWRAAAAIFLVVASSILVYKQIIPNRQADTVALSSEIQPGSNKASLTLADGSQIELSDTLKGQIITQGSLQIQKTKIGEITYSAGSKAPFNPSATNTVSTPRAGQYCVVLPDGTKAWLNAESSLSYPIKFAKKERRVKMKGEVYFEVAKSFLPNSDKRLPFFVETDQQLVQVLGTHFNINAYPSEPAVKTTLLEGSVIVRNSKGQELHLEPGKMTVLNQNFSVHTADLDTEMAWKNGDFIFKGERLETALRQISRWYDVDIECPPHLGSLRFNGMISRTQPLSTIVEMIQLTKLANVKIKGRRLIVTD